MEMWDRPPPDPEPEERYKLGPENPRYHNYLKGKAESGEQLTSEELKTLNEGIKRSEMWNRPPDDSDTVGPSSESEPGEPGERYRLEPENPRYHQYLKGKAERGEQLTQREWEILNRGLRRSEMLNRP
jgi:hypothetical protein